MLTRTRTIFKDLWAVIVKNVADSSSKNSWNKTDFLKILRNALFVGTSASLLFIIENLAENMLSSLVQGLAIALLNGVVEAVFKFIKNNEEKVDDSTDTEPKV